jgi:hypothetical protein
MSTDRTTKALLLAIALGLWANVIGDWLKPVVIEAQANRLGAPANVTDHQLLREIEKGVTLMATGLCPNKKICG